MSYRNKLVFFAGDNQDYQIERSIRLNDDDTAYFNWTPGTASNRNLWNLGIWFKRANLSSVQVLFNADTTSSDSIWLDANDKLNIQINGTVRLVSNQVFRDPTNHGHFFIRYDAANATADLRLIVWYNGEEITSWSTNTRSGITTNTCKTNTTVVHRLGRGDSASYWDGLFSEIIFTDGQSTLVTELGKTHLLTGVWSPKAYSGSYGNNGYYLDFSDNSNTTSGTLGKDRSGNNNDWTPTNFSITAGIGNDSLTDTPTNNFSVLCSVSKHQGAGIEIRNGGLQYYSSGASFHYFALGSLGIHEGEKKYFEYVAAAGTSMGVGVANEELYSIGAAADEANTSAGVWVYLADGNKRTASTSTAYGSTYTTSDVIGVAIDATSITAIKIWFHKNGTWQASGDPVAGTNAAYTNIAGPLLAIIKGYNNSAAGGSYINFGQRPFAHTPPTGYDEICTQNISKPSVQNPKNNVETFTITGTGSAGSKSGLLFQPDWVRVKRFTSGNQTTPFFTNIRGTGKYKPVQTSTAETTDAQSITAFNSDGFSYGTSTVLNASAVDFLFLALKSSPSNGIEIVTWTGNGSATQVVNHTLGKKPSMVMAHGMGATLTYLWHRKFASDAHWCAITTTTIAAEVNTNSPFSAWSTSTFTVTNNATNNLNSNAVVYVAILFADGPLFASGKYTANANTDGPFFYCGFRPALICWSAASNQQWHSVNRGLSTDYNGNASQDSDSFMTGNGVTTYSGSTDILAVGGKIRSTTANYQNGSNRPWFALAEQAGKYARAV